MADIARENGWSVPSAADLAEIKTLARQEQELRELSDAQRATAERQGNVAEAETEKAAATLAERAHLKREMQALWLRWTAPLTFKSAEGQRNIARAVGEITSANLLLRPGFFTRQMIDVVTQNFIYTPTRATAEAIMRYRNDKAAGREGRLLSDVTAAMGEAYKARTGALRAALANARRALHGRSETKNVEQILDHISIFDRAELKADELAAEGKTAQAFAMRVATWFQFAFRYAKALDELQGVLAEAQEMRAQTVTALRAQGIPPAEAETKANLILGDAKAEWMLAMARTQQIFEAAGINATKKQLEESAFDVVKARQYTRIGMAKLVDDDFEGQNRLLRNTIGWNERESGGLGGVFADFGRGLQRFGEGLASGGPAGLLLGMPIIALTRFSNAVGVSINRALTFTPLGFWEGAFGDSPWFHTERDKLQRKVEAAAGTSLGLMVMALVAAGIITPLWKWPDKDSDRDLWRRAGRQPGTLEINLGGGRVMTFSMTVGPFAPLRPWLTFMGALLEGATKANDNEEKLAQKAEKKGLEPAANKTSGIDVLAAAGAASYSAILGGRTAFGIISNMTDNRTPINAGRVAASTISPLIPGVPQWQEMSRMAGVQLNYRDAGFIDFLLPMAGSGTEKRNFFNDPLNEQTTQRVVKVLTGGTYPFAVTKPAQDTEKAYSVLLDSGWRPPPAMNAARRIGDQFRQFSPDEFKIYLQKRGEALKREVADTDFSGMDPQDVRDELDKIYKQVNKEAVQDTIDAIEDQTAGTGNNKDMPVVKRNRENSVNGTH